MKTVVKMILEKETPGAVRYQEVNDNGQKVDDAVAMLRQTYIRKLAFNGGAIPKAITITIES